MWSAGMHLHIDATANMLLLCFEEWHARDLGNANTQSTIYGEITPISVYVLYFVYNYEIGVFVYLIEYELLQIFKNSF